MRLPLRQHHGGTCHGEGQPRRVESRAGGWSTVYTTRSSNKMNIKERENKEPSGGGEGVMAGEVGVLPHGTLIVVVVVV